MKPVLPVAVILATLAFFGLSRPAQADVDVVVGVGVPGFGAVISTGPVYAPYPVYAPPVYVQPVVYPAPRYYAPRYYAPRYYDHGYKHYRPAKKHFKHRRGGCD